MTTNGTSTGTATVTLPSDTQLQITREFDAPRHLVYRVYTEPELIKRWWSGGMGEVTLAEVDLRVGGTWRYVMVAGGGFEVGFHGEFLEIVTGERIVNTEIFEGAPDSDPAVDTVTFDEHDGRTTLTLTMQLTSQEARDMVLNSGMEAGMQAGWDLIEQLARSLG